MLIKLSICLTLAICAVVQQIPLSSAQNMCNCPSTGSCKYMAWSASCETTPDCAQQSSVPKNAECINKVCCVPQDQSGGSGGSGGCPQGLQSVGNCMTDVKDPNMLCHTFNKAAVCKSIPANAGTPSANAGVCCIPKDDHYYYYYH